MSDKASTRIHKIELNKTFITLSDKVSTRLCNVELNKTLIPLSGGDGLSEAKCNVAKTIVTNYRHKFARYDRHKFAR